MVDKFKWNTLDIDHTAVSQQCCTLNDVFQFTQVSMPHVFSENVLYFRRKSFHILSKLAVGLLQEVICKNHNIICTLSQRRHIDLKFVKAVIQVFAELTLP